ncbi:hypothetical protein P5V15_009545 [Pogonomyrmex californicus]
MALIYHFARLILTVWVCESGKNQALEIGTTIHDVLNCTSDKQIKDELKLFSLQILHRDNTFSAKFFAVDASFFASMVGNVTTYLIILVQFLNMTNSCNMSAINEGYDMNEGVIKTGILIKLFLNIFFIITTAI